MDIIKAIIGILTGVMMLFLLGNVFVAAFPILLVLIILVVIGFFRGEKARSQQRNRQYTNQNREQYQQQRQSRTQSSSQSRTSGNRDVIDAEFTEEEILD